MQTKLLLVWAQLTLTLQTELKIGYTKGSVQEDAVDLKRAQTKNIKLRCMNRVSLLSSTLTICSALGFFMSKQHPQDQVL